MSIKTVSTILLCGAGVALVAAFWQYVVVALICGFVVLSMINEIVAGMRCNASSSHSYSCPPRPSSPVERYMDGGHALHSGTDPLVQEIQRRSDMDYAQNRAEEAMRRQAATMATELRFNQMIQDVKNNRGPR